MSRKYILALCSCLIISICGDAQQKDMKFSVTIAPAVLHSVVFQPGFQYSFSNWALLGEVSHVSAKKMDFDEGYWTRAQVELKRFLTRKDVKFYCSFQSAYSVRKFVDADSGFYFTDRQVDSGAVYSSAIIHSPVLSFAPKIGAEINLGRTIFIDAFIGLGVRTLFNNYDARNVTPSIAFHKKEWGPDAAWRFDQTETRFHVPMGLRLGARF